MPKFFVKTNQIEGNRVKIIGEDVKHITQVLRTKKGEEIVVCDLDTSLNYITVLEQIQPNTLICKIIDCKKDVAESKIEVTIFQGLPKADKMEYMIQKNIELGAKAIIPVSMERCIVKLEEKKTHKKIERWQKIAEAAAKQSRRDFVPKIELPITVEKLCDRVKEFDLMLLAYENEQENTLKQELQKFQNPPTLKIGVIVGPEGGLDEKEVKKLVEAGAKAVTLGKRILRTETASIAIMSNIIYEFEM